MIVYVFVDVLSVAFVKSIAKSDAVFTFSVSIDTKLGVTVAVDELVIVRLSVPSPPSMVSADVSPVIVIASLPAPALMLSDPVLTVMTSLPAPASTTSSPAPSVIVSLPSPPTMLSLPASPFKVSLPAPPRIVSLSAPPDRLSLPAPAVDAVSARTSSCHSIVTCTTRDYVSTCT